MVRQQFHTKMASRKHHRQTSLLSHFVASKKQALAIAFQEDDSEEREESLSVDFDEGGVAVEEESGSVEEVSGNEDSVFVEEAIEEESLPVEEDSLPAEEESVEEESVTAADLGAEPEEQDPESLVSVSTELCDGSCCSDETKPFQPTTKAALRDLTRNGRKFNPEWFGEYPWLTLCMTKKKVFCLYCRSVTKHGLLEYSKNSHPAFIVDGFSNWKKAGEKFSNHASSHAHKEAVLKWSALHKPSVAEHLNTELKRLQHSRRQAFLVQLHALKYLLRQGLALRSHTANEGNFHQLLVAWSNDCTADLHAWMESKKYMSPVIINELITMMGQSVLRKILSNMKKCDPCWYGIIADEATDVVNREQLNLSVRWVDNDYGVFEDPLGLFCLPDTKADTIATVIKDLLLRCNLPLNMCRGQAYDGAANMQGKRAGVAARIKNDNPAAISVHCFAHSLNLCLQDAGRQISLLRNALETVREIAKLINFSPKRSHLFKEKLMQSEHLGGVSLKPLCPTRWTARTAAFEAVLKDYSTLIEAMDEIHQTTHDEYGLKAHGLLLALEKFDTHFGLNLAYLLFGAAEEVSKSLQAKSITLQEGLSAVKLASSFYQRQRKDEAFDLFYDRVMKSATDLNLDEPQLPRYRRAPRRYDDGSCPHQFSTPKEYYRSLYFEACDLLIHELQDRFDRQETLAPVLALESVVMSAANGESFSDALQVIQTSCYGKDFNFMTLKRHLLLLVDIVKEACPAVSTVTKVQTVCEALNSNKVYKVIVSEVHKLLKLYLTIPITSSTSERTFSVLKRLLTYLRSTMTEQRLNNCLLLHIHRQQTDELNLKDLAKEFVSINSERKLFFGSF